jgi:hypothetical protein
MDLDGFEVMKSQWQQLDDRSVFPAEARLSHLVQFFALVPTVDRFAILELLRPPSPYPIGGGFASRDRGALHSTGWLKAGALSALPYFFPSVFHPRRRPFPEITSGSVASARIREDGLPPPRPRLRLSKEDHVCPYLYIFLRRI